MSKIKNEYSCALILTNDLIGGKWKLRILWHIVHGEIGMGKDFSKNLGVHYNLVLFMGLTIAAMIAASVVVVVGSISYIGLIVPNIVAMFKGDRIRGTLIDTALFGAIFVLLCFYID